MSLYMYISSYQYTIHNVQEITQSGREKNIPRNKTFDY